MSKTDLHNEAAKQEPDRLQSDPGAVEDPRERLLAGLPVSEKRLELAGVSTSILEGGEGLPIVFLHGPGEYAAKWLRVIPDLATTHRVIAPDLPGHGASDTIDGTVEPDRVLAWLDELIDRTCNTPPVLVGQILGGAIAARFAASRSDRLRSLVLSDSLGLSPFQPAPEFGAALMGFLSDPNEETHEELWQRCAYDLDRMRNRMGAAWDRIRAYNLDRAQDASLRPTQEGLMEQFGFPEVPPAELARITVPVTLVWGRHDLATSLSVAEAASARYGWPLHVVENAADDPPIEQPAAFVEVLRGAIAIAGSA